jgi:hypothetical protein
MSYVEGEWVGGLSVGGGEAEHDAIVHTTPQQRQRHRHHLHTKTIDKERKADKRGGK